MTVRRKDGDNRASAEFDVASSPYLCLADPTFCIETTRAASVRQVQSGSLSTRQKLQKQASLLQLFFLVKRRIFQSAHEAKRLLKKLLKVMLVFNTFSHMQTRGIQVLKSGP